MRKIELLSPAKNLECGLAAINHGADAVYIGAPKFGARAAAGNSTQDIEQLSAYAHRFNARIYAAVNTILSDEELPDVEKLIWELYHAGADAVIVQDMGILQLNLPPIALHASTQTDNRTAEKVQFLEKTGFSQVVLARELSLEQIKSIAQQSSVPLEFFVHGALCVSYSGQCYISQALCNRSANRGECAQYCRLPYDLIDANGTILAKNKHLLSLKDLNLSDYLSDLLDAGVSSFKIEGRLKDADYVKNITAFYRQKLDVVLEGSDKYKKSSSGKTTFFFSPNPEKSFHRGSCNYFLKGRNLDITSFDTPKSIGEYIGTIKQVNKNSIQITTEKELHNGDGLCFIDKSGEFNGFRANKAEGNTVFVTQTPVVQISTKIFRNLDIDFEKQLSNKSSERKIGVKMIFSENENGFALQVSDEDGNSISENMPAEKTPAIQAEKATETLIAQLSKLGNTDFLAEKIEIKTSQAYFLRASEIADLRRRAFENLTEFRLKNYPFERKTIQPSTHLYPEKALSYLGNVHNRLAEDFYRQHGVKTIALSFERAGIKNVPLMFTRHCLKYSLGACTRFSPKPISKLDEPLTLQHKNFLLSIEFNCKDCEMIIKQK
jgi:putative protease